MSNKRWRLGVLCLAMMLVFGGCGQAGNKAIDSEETSSVDASEDFDSARDASTESSSSGDFDDSDSGASDSSGDGMDLGDGAAGGSYTYDENVQLLHTMSGSLTDYEWDDKSDKILAQISTPIVRLASSDADAYPELVRTLEHLNGEKRAQQAQDLQDLVVDAYEMLETDKKNFTTCKDIETVAVRRCDTAVTSLLYEVEYNNSTNHGGVHYWGTNIDSQSGRILGLWDVVSDMDSVAEIIQNELLRLYPGTFQADTLDVKGFFDAYPENISWCLDYHGLTFFFNPYDLNANPYEVQEITLEYSAFPGLVNEIYAHGPASYGMELSDCVPFCYDVNGDGELDLLETRTTRDEWDYITKETILLNGRDVSESDVGFTMDPILIHMEDGRNYLYLQFTSENDYRSIRTYNLSSGTIEPMKPLPSGMYGVFDEAESLTLQYQLCDPANFPMATYTDVLSTCHGIKTYHIGPKGVPESDQDMFRFDRPFKLRLKKDMKLEKYENGQAVGKVKVKKGTAIYYTATNNKKVAELKTEDGTVYRVKLKSRGWPKMIGDDEIDEIFEGIIFAG